MILGYADALQKYGSMVNGVWVFDEAKWCSLLSLPAQIQAVLINSISGGHTNHIYCNKDLQTPILNAFGNLTAANLVNELKTFDGCFMKRDVRGMPGKMSTHSLALAIDLNAKENPLGGPIEFSPDFVKCFTNEGFSWGGTFSRVDGMHFSFAWE